MRVVRAARPYPGQRFFAASAKLERVLVQVVVVLGLVLIASQLLLTIPAVRYVMSYVDRLEGVALDPGGASVTVSLVSGSPAQGARLLVNGEPAATFSTGLVRVAVAGGDLIEIDGTGLSGEGRFKVVAVEGGVSSPQVGLEVQTAAGVASLGRVEFETSGGQ